jgi:uncharacterized protein (TIGR03000 family)
VHYGNYGRYYGNFGRSYGYGYRPLNRPGYGYGYWRNGVWIGLGLGYALNSPYYGNSYGYYSGYNYPYSYGATYYPDYGVSSTTVVTPEPSISAYPPPAEQAPPPAPVDAARIVVQLPPSAQLWLDGQVSTQTGAIRTFETPGGLQPGRTYTYKLVAQWVENGVPVTRERDVTFQAGGEIVVNMNVP